MRGGRTEIYFLAQHSCIHSYEEDMEKAEHVNTNGRIVAHVYHALMLKYRKVRVIYVCFKCLCVSKCHALISFLWLFS